MSETISTTVKSKTLIKKIVVGTPIRRVVASTISTESIRDLNTQSKQNYDFLVYDSDAGTYISSRLEFNNGIVGSYDTGSNTYTINATQNIDSSSSPSFENITVKDTLIGPTTFVIDPAGDSGNLGTLIVKGNLQVDGATTTINSTTLSVEDRNITLAAGATDSNAANGAGIFVEGGNVTINYQSGFNRWLSNISIYSLRDLISERDVVVGRHLEVGDSATIDGNLFVKNSATIIGNLVTSGSIRADDFTGNYLGFDSDFHQSIQAVDGDIIPSTNLTYTLGNSTHKWSELHVGGNTIYLGNLLLKDSSTTFSIQDSSGNTVQIDMSGNTTDDLTEGSNLYYTRSRFDSALGDTTSIDTIRGYFSSGGDLSYDSATGQFSFDVEQVYTKDNFDSDFALVVGQATGNGTGLEYDSEFNRLSIGDTNVTSGYYGSATQIPVLAINSKGQIDSAGVVNVASLSGVDYNTSTGTITVTASNGDSFNTGITLNPFSTNDLSEGNNLYYTTNRADSDTLAYLINNGYATETYVDSNITIAINNVLDGAPAALDTLNELAEAINDDSNFAGTITSALSAKFNSADFNSTFDTRLGTKSTTDLAEGNNLYYTKSRTDSDVAQGFTDRTTNDLTEGDNLYYTTTRADSDFDNRLDTKSTDDLAEGLNLYYTTLRADSDFDTRLATKSTADVAEGDNLYYTRARFDSDLSDSASIQTVRDMFSSSGDITYEPTTGQFSIDVEVVYTADNFDSDLDAAISGGTGLNYNVNDNTVNIDSAELAAYFSTNNITEGDNLYYTRVRFDSALGDAISTQTIRDYFSVGSNGLKYDSALGIFDIDSTSSVNIDQIASSLINVDTLLASDAINLSSTYTTLSASNSGITLSHAPPTGNLSSLLLDSGNSTLVASNNLGLQSTGGQISIIANTGAVVVGGTSVVVNGNTNITGQLNVDSAVVEQDLAVGGNLTVDSGITADTLTGEYLGFDSDLARTTSRQTIRGYFSAGGDLTYDSATGQFTFDVEQVYTKTNFDSDLNLALETDAVTTTDLTEGDNLYYTDARVDSNITYTGISLNDGVFAKFGNDSDLLIGHTVSNSFITNNTNTLYAETPNFSVVKRGSFENMIVATGEGSVSLYYDGDKKLETTTTGVDITGQLAVDSATISGDARADRFLSTNTTLAAPIAGNYASERVRLYDFADSNRVNYAIGVEQNAIWMSVDTNLAGQGFKWYGDSVQVARLNAVGDFDIVGDLTAATLTGKYLGFDSDFNDKSTSDLSEGSNLYYTTTRADSDFDIRLATKSTTDLAEGNNLYYTKARVDSDIDQGFNDRTTDTLVEGSTNLYYTDARADSDAKNAISVTDNGGDGSLTYTPATGVIDYTGPSAAEARAHFSVGANGLNYNSSTGVFDIDSTGSIITSTLNVVNNLVVDGNLQVNGTTTTVSTQNLEVADNMIYLNAGESAGSPTQFIDVGWSANVNDTGTFTHTGVFRDATDGVYKIYQGYIPAPDSDLDIDTNHPSFAYAPLRVASITADTLTGVYQGFDSDFNDKSTSDLSEGTNLYYTTTRFDSDFGNNTTSDLAEGSNLYYTTVRADSDFDVRLATKSTADLVEGANLYYTKVRVDSDVTQGFTDRTTTDLVEGANLYYTKVRVDSDVDQGFLDRTTTDLVEGDNLYYTTTRADSDAKNAINVVDNGGDGSLTYIPTTGVISYTGPSAAEVRAHFSAAGDLSYDSATGRFSFDVEDVYTQANFDSDFNTALDAAAIDGIGLVYNAGLNALSIDSGELAAYFSTGNITEGSNLYYTRSRFDAALNDSTSTQTIRDYFSVIDNGGDGSLTFAPTTGEITYTGPSAAEVRAHFSAAGDLSYDSATGRFSIDVEDIYTAANFDSDLSATSTDFLPEGSTNFYYTAVRVDSDFDSRLATKSTTDVAEGNNLYYTKGRTDSDIVSYLTTNSFATQTYVNNSINAVLDNAPAALDTLNELAAAINDDSNFAGTVTANLATKLNISNFDSSFDTRLATKSTTNLSEGDNLYYTSNRVDSDIIALVDSNYVANRVTIPTELRLISGVDSGSVTLLSSNLEFIASEAIDIVVSNNQITVAVEDASISNKGVANFDSDQFIVTSGYVQLSVIDGGTF